MAPARGERGALIVGVITWQWIKIVWFSKENTEIKRVMTEKNISAFEASRIITGKYQDKTQSKKGKQKKPGIKKMKEEWKKTGRK